MTAVTALTRPAFFARHDRSVWTTEARALIALAIPLVGAQLAQMVIMTTDVVLLGRFSQSALAAAAIGNTISFFAWMLGSGPTFAVSPMVAQLIGEKPRSRGGVRAALRMSLWSVAITATPLMALMWFAGPLLRAVGEDAALSADAGRFVAMLSLGLPFTLAAGALRNFANALGRPRAGLWVMCATILFNGAAGYALIFGHLGAPRMGIVGSGLATSLSCVFSFAAMLAIVLSTKTLSRYRPLRRFHRPAFPKLAEVFRLGMPIGATMLFEAMLFNTMTLVMGRFGLTALAAHQIALNFASLTFMAPLGVGMASTVRVGLAAGSRDMAAARRAGLVAFALAFALALVSAAVMALFGREIAGLYLGGRGERDVATIDLAAEFLTVAAAFQVFDSLQVVGAQSLRGLKDARAPMILAAVSYWLVGAPICLLLGLVMNLQGLGIWIGLAAGLAAAMVAMGSRFWWLTDVRRASGRLPTSPPGR